MHVYGFSFREESMILVERRRRISELNYSLWATV
jgi:hypothetical protein